MDRTAPPTGSGSPKRSALASIVQFFALFCLVFGLYFILQSIYYYRSSLGTPTTATIDHCDQHGNPHARCYAKWSVGAVSQTGPIVTGPRDYHEDPPIGSQVDVHVRNGHAYKGHPSPAMGIVLVSGCCFAIATGAVLYWSARRKIKTGGWPWSPRL